MDRAEVEIRSHAMTDLERKLEEIARNATESAKMEGGELHRDDGMIHGAWFVTRGELLKAVNDAIQAASQATARYCAEIVKAVPERGWDENHPQASWMNGYVAGFDMAAETILRECGVKE